MTLCAPAQVFLDERLGSERFVLVYRAMQEIREVRRPFPPSPCLDFPIRTRTHAPAPPPRLQITWHDHP